MFILVLATGAILIGACELTSRGERELVCSTDPVPGTIHPLETGNSWTYSNFDIYGYEHGHNTMTVGEEIRIPVAENIPSAYEILWDDYDGDDPRRLAINRNDGFYYVGQIQWEDIQLHPVLYVKYPAEKGDEFAGGAPVFGAEGVTENTSTYEVVSTDSSIATPAGVFVAYVYRREFQPLEDVSLLLTEDYFYAPGVGLVGRNVHSKNGTIKRLLRLYELCR